MAIGAVAIPGLPELRPGDDLAALIGERAGAAGIAIGDGDVVAIAQKAVSKVEGRLRSLSEIEPTEHAQQLALEQAKDPRVVQTILDESSEVLRAERGVLICVTRHGFVCANAGVDTSNAGNEDRLVLLPEDPDLSARNLRARLHELTGASPAVLIADSFGRAWRHGQVDVAIGCAGLAPLEDWRGRKDADGRELSATWIALADEAAAAASLARRKDSREPVVVLRGLDRHVISDDGPGAGALSRPRDQDLFR